MGIVHAGEHELKRVGFLQKIMLVRHKHEYLKYRYLEAGCLNEKVKTGLRERKMYHYKKYKNMI